MAQPLASLSSRTEGVALAQTRGFHHGNLRQALIEADLAVPDIEGLSLRQIATGLGVTAAAAYRHFESREAMLDEVARVGFGRLEARFAAAFDISSPPFDGSEARTRMQRLAQAYLQFADDQPALWRLLFGVQGASYRAAVRIEHRRSSYDYLPAALMGLHRTGVIVKEPDARDALFAWSAIHGAASLRNGQIAPALVEVGQLAQEVAQRVIRSLQ